MFWPGHYLYHFTGIWVDVDEGKRPKSIPRLFGWDDRFKALDCLRLGNRAPPVIAASYCPDYT
jgi:hypothetical protein